jgi:hypothetical protein
VGRLCPAVAGQEGDEREGRGYGEEIGIGSPVAQQGHRSCMAVEAGEVKGTAQFLRGVVCPWLDPDSPLQERREGRDIVGLSSEHERRCWEETLEVVGSREERRGGEKGPDPCEQVEICSVLRQDVDPSHCAWRLLRLQAEEVDRSLSPLVPLRWDRGGGNGDLVSDIYIGSPVAEERDERLVAGSAGFMEGGVPLHILGIDLRPSLEQGRRHFHRTELSRPNERASLADVKGGREMEGK